MPLDLTRIRALCFDLDGTLSDTDDQFVLQLAGWLKPGQRIFRRGDPQDLARRIVMATEGYGAILYGLPDRLGVDAHLARLGEYLGRRARRPLPSFLLIPGVAEMLACLAERYPLSVVSARGRIGAQTFLNQYGLAPHFRCVVTAQTCRYTKPYPHPVRWAAREMNVPPENCVMIGDTVIDIRAGKAAGAQTVGVLCGFGEEAELRRAGADLIVNSTPDLVDVLLGAG